MTGKNPHGAGLGAAACELECRAQTDLAQTPHTRMLTGLATAVLLVVASLVSSRHVRTSSAMQPQENLRASSARSCACAGVGQLLVSSQSMEKHGATWLVELKKAVEEK